MQNKKTLKNIKSGNFTIQHTLFKIYTPSLFFCVHAHLSERDFALIIFLLILFKYNKHIENVFKTNIHLSDSSQDEHPVTTT